MPMFESGAEMKQLALVLALVCSMSFFAEAQNTGDSAARSNILSLEHAWDQALQRQDVKALADIFDSGLIYVDYDGKLMTKTDYLAWVKLDTSHLQQVVSEELIVQMFGNTAIVVGAYRATGTEGGKPFLRRGRYIDTWILEGRNWICISASATPILH
jgi:ketosteroid isomerase-like protein